MTKMSYGEKNAYLVSEGLLFSFSVPFFFHR